MLLAVLLALLSLLNLMWGIFNRRWDEKLRAQRALLIQPSPSCYACVTGASVTSFSTQSSNSFCRHHKAHWHLINDLENKTEITPTTYENRLEIQDIIARHYPGTKDLQDVRVQCKEVVYNGYGDVIRHL
jgi:hypothetical protein